MHKSCGLVGFYLFALFLEPYGCNFLLVGYDSRKSTYTRDRMTVERSVLHSFGEIFQKIEHGLSLGQFTASKSVRGLGCL